jgi:hypothetical protein
MFDTPRNNLIGRWIEAKQAHSDTASRRGAISSAPIVLLAGTASRPPSGRRVAMASPA